MSRVKPACNYYSIQQLDKIKKIITRREFYFATLIIVVLLVYAMFFKPNPWIRVNVNKIYAGKDESALSLDAPDSISGVGKKFTVSINLDTKGNAVNAVQSYLIFDPNVLEVVTTDTEKSFCKFYPENNYDNAKGIIKLSCGSPYPGFRGTDTLEKIEFLPKAIQTTTISLTPSSMVLANDGKGTNLLKVLPSKEIKIKSGL